MYASISLPAEPARAELMALHTPSRIYVHGAKVILHIHRDKVTLWNVWLIT